MHHNADAVDDVLRLSMEANAIVKVGPFARGGKSRMQVDVVDHAFQPLATVTPVGIFLPTLEELFGYGVTSKGTRACLVVRLAQWWEAVRERFAPITTLVLNVDNGPEHHSRRTQRMPQMVPCVQQYRVTVRLAYYPPSHSKYNPIARCWGIREHHWNGTLLDSLDTVLPCARTLTWNGQPPIVALVPTTDQPGGRLTQEATEVVAAQSERLPALGKWFVDIVPPAMAIRDTSLFLRP